MVEILLRVGKRELVGEAFSAFHDLGQVGVRRVVGLDLPVLHSKPLLHEHDEGGAAWELERCGILQERKEE